MTRLRTLYYQEIRKSLIEELGLKNEMQVPRLEKIVLNMGVGRADDSSKAVEKAVEELSLITGQKAVATSAKKSIAGFKLREGMHIGAKVTLRGNKMYEFLDRFITVAMPRIRDFQGISPKSFDGHGNLSLGVKEQLIFPEIDYDRIDQVRGFDITLVTSASDNKMAEALLRKFNFPLQK